MAYEISLFPELIEGALVGPWTTPIHLMQASAVSMWDEAGRFIHSRWGVELPFQSSEAYFPFSCLNPRLCLPALYSDFRSDFSLLPILHSGHGAITWLFIFCLLSLIGPATLHSGFILQTHLLSNCDVLGTISDTEDKL